jgi:MFS transporter, ACS family, solute carrier family 17 (sodium-dependent inorganic phosphate cotransporter), other
MTMPMSGFLIAHFGWESVFYVTGIISTVWSVLWFFLVYDSPSEHPRIADEERRFIENAIGTSASPKGHVSLPLDFIPLTHIPLKITIC